MNSGLHASCTTSETKVDGSKAVGVALLLSHKPRFTRGFWFVNTQRRSTSRESVTVAPPLLI